VGPITIGRRKSKSKTRKSNIRTVGKVFAISIEGRATEKKYFDSLNLDLEGCTITYVPRKWTRTEPFQVLQDLLAYKSMQTRVKQKSDQYWLVIDHDETDTGELRRVSAKASQNNCYVADSKPCFELWLLLHYKPLHRYHGLEASGDNSPCSPAERLLEKEDESYERHKKGKYIAIDYMDKTGLAIRHAKHADKDPKDKPLKNIGTRVYRLLDRIREMDSS